MSHDRWVFAQRPLCQACRVGRLIYRGSSQTGRIRYAVCPHCLQRFSIIAMCRIEEDAAGIPRLILS